MSDELVSREELEALLEETPDSAVSRFDFEQQHNLQVRQMRRLVGIREKFIELFSRSLREMFDREAAVELKHEKASRFGDYIAGLTPPLDVNLIYIMPDRRPAIVVLEATLLYVLVDQYFGGDGSLKGRCNSNNLSATERRTAQHLVELICRDLGRSWAGVAGVSFQSAESFTSPDNLRVFGVNDMVFETSFSVGFEDNLGELHVVLPYSMLEANKTALAGDLEPERDIDEVWQKGLSREVGAAEVRVAGLINVIELSVEELVRLQPGDVVPFEMPDLLTVQVQGIPLFHGTFGRVNNHHAIQILGSCDSGETKLESAAGSRS